jgi:hypothetical protein
MKILSAIGLLVAGSLQVFGDVGLSDESTSTQPSISTLQISDNTATPSSGKMGQHAEEQCRQWGGKKDGSSDQSRVSRLQFGGNYTHASIKLHNQYLFHGNLGGAQGIYEYRPWDNFYAALSVAWKQGKTTNPNATRRLVYADTHERLGYTYASQCKNWVASLFTGFGYRHLGHKLEQSGESIKFEYNEFYVPLGFVSDYFFNSWFAGGLNFTWMPQVYSTVKIVPLKGARWILKNSVNNFIAEIPLTFFVTQNRLFSVIFKPFYEYWQDGKSTAKLSNGVELGLPGNCYNFWGAELNLAFSF